MKASSDYNVSVITDRLLARLDAIGDSLKQRDDALALIGLGSVGIEQSRLDDYSDLDFFAVVRRGRKATYIDDLAWLSDVHPIAFAFRNTVDGYKLMYADGIFCEMAVFDPDELAYIPFAPGRLVWQHPDFDASLAIPAPQSPRAPLENTVEWILGEALTNLYVGLSRWQRGEKLAAQRSIEHFALDRLLELSTRVETPTTALEDPYTLIRRYELRYPITAGNLSAFLQGYDRVPESARAILIWLDAHFEVNAVMKAHILALCGSD